MAKRDVLQEQLNELIRLNDKELEPCDIELIKKHLHSKQSLLIAKAVKLVAAHELHDLAETVEQIFPRLMSNCVKTDAQCHAKKAIVECLSDLREPARDIFRQSLKHVQMEPVWGDHVDTACDLRGKAAVALAYFGDDDILYELIELLTDEHPNVRAYVARALAIVGGVSSELILRSLILNGEDDPETIGEACAGLLSIDEQQSLPFIQEQLLHRADVLAGEAAYAIGASRCEGACAVLTEAFEQAVVFDEQRIFIMPLISLRDQVADDFLCSLYKDGSRSIVAEIDRCLELFTDSLQLKKRITENNNP